MAEIPNVVGGQAVVREAKLRRLSPVVSSPRVVQLAHSKSGTSLSDKANEEGEAVAAVAPSAAVSYPVGKICNIVLVIRSGNSHARLFNVL